MPSPFVVLSQLPSDISQWPFLHACCNGSGWYNTKTQVQLRSRTTLGAEESCALSTGNFCDHCELSTNYCACAGRRRGSLRTYHCSLGLRRRRMVAWTCARIGQGKYLSAALNRRHLHPRPSKKFTATLVWMLSPSHPS